MRSRAAALAAILPLATACAAVYPEAQTPLRDAPGGRELKPPPPEDLFFIALAGADVPERTRDGRMWHELGSKLPDPFAILFVNGKEIIRTNVETSTLHPTWPESSRGNFRVLPGDRIRIELWEAALVNKPMCVKDLGAVQAEWATRKQLDIDCESGAIVRLSFEPAHGKLGYGFFYEFRTASVGVTRVFEESPAARAGLKPGDELVLVGDRVAKTMKTTEVESFLGASRVEGVSLTIRHPGGEQVQVQLKEGGVYPLYAETAYAR
jgi:hypothetical protein